MRSRRRGAWGREGEEGRKRWAKEVDEEERKRGEGVEEVEEVKTARGTLKSVLSDWVA